MLVTEIIGSLNRLNIAERTIDTVQLQWFEANRRLMRKISARGVDVAFKLFQEGACLQHDDVVYLDAHSALVIQIEPCAVIVLSPQTLPEMARACYEIGNKHAPLFLDGDEVLVPYDAPMFAWLAAAGFAPRQETRRLNHALRSNSAQGHGHAHHHHDGDGDAEHNHGRDYRSRVFRAAP